MARKTTIYCDICQNEINDNSWEYSPRKLTLTTFCNRQNPMRLLNGVQSNENTFISEDTCAACMLTISSVITDTIQSIKKIEPLPV